ncbi:MucB/RseB C-terminal domain-containing protein [Calidifontimicrobium sp. SYSU G02091]|uniref:MucB/RseB C-terminal domain-containing protein n=1 Tax=Calidifontimicrobium sp. SYSU G02091 TaxID=2926421 RepID=UPI001F53558E|nr:MucB/RseB C-terminal domain-containing protein [Calidifontimicrobium sp. SYSU G02091]MCI1190503.1 MucB/RseB C-terminal domain-containing protein [Calidifontimicrobium sp. SYSU G02091]
MRSLIRCLVLAVSAGFVSASWAADAAAAGSSAADPSAWIRRIHEAVAYGNYQGTLVSSVGGVVSSSRIAHYCDGRQQFERVEMLDGQNRVVYRHNDVVHTLWPTQRVAVVERRDEVDAGPALLRVQPDARVFERYELRAEGDDRVAGHDATVYLLQPRDDARFAQRLWVERRSGLLLRTDVLSSDGRVLESAAFSDVTIGVKPQPDVVLRSMKRLDGYRVLRPTLAPTELAAEGWQIAPVPGFVQVRGVRRSVAAGESEHDDTVLQAVFSDGLTHVSVFIEPYREGRHRAGQTAIGATHTLMKRHDQWWVTVMGDVPMTTVARFADAVQRRR